MSRLGKRPIMIPENTEVSLETGRLTVKGPLGVLSRPFSPAVKVELTDREVRLTPEKDYPEAKALLGTFVSHLRNMITGVNAGFTKRLALEGIGYRAVLSGDRLTLYLGFSHPIDVVVPVGLKVNVEKNIIVITGSDKELVGQFASKIRALRPPEPYKGKGVRYENEVVRRKEGKKVSA